MKINNNELDVCVTSQCRSGFGDNTDMDGV